MEIYFKGDGAVDLCRHLCRSNFNIQLRMALNNLLREADVIDAYK
jgi:hypothetical protein